jgi:hypothetical protein
MRLLHLLSIVPVVLARPAKPSQQNLPELSVEEWASIQSGLFDGVRSLTSWSWEHAEHIVDEWVDDNEKCAQAPAPADESDQTIWAQLKADPDNFSRLVKIIEVSWLPFGVMYLDRLEKHTRPRL